jgi:NifB/MoaA-like Fe-S oxidoreductase
LVFELAGKQEFEEADRVYEETWQILEIARSLASGLHNATVVTPDANSRLDIVTRIETLYRAHEGDLEIARSLALGLYNATVVTPDANSSLDIVTRIETLYRAHEGDADIGSQLFRVRTILLLNTPADAPEFTPYAQNLAAELTRQLQNEQTPETAQHLLETLQIGVNVGQKINPPVGEMLADWLRQLTQDAPNP